MMSRRKSRELRMLREIAHYFLPRHTCSWCHKPLLDWENASHDLGHSTPKPITVEITINHVDGHPNGNTPKTRNNSKENHEPMHRKCHKQMEAKRLWELRKAGKNPKVRFAQKGKAA